MSRDIAISLGAYLISICVIALIGTLVGSFVVLRWWTPLSSVQGRGMVAWLAVAPTIICFMHRRIS